MGTLKKAVRAREALGQLRFVLPPTKTRTTCLVRHQDAKLAPPSDLRGGQLEVTCLIGNNRLFKPLRKSLGEAVHLLSRPRSNTVLYAVPTSSPGKAGRPRKYGPRLGNAADLAARMRPQAHAYTLHVYGALREILAAEQVVMLRTLRCPVRVVWVYRKTQWVALMTTDLTLSVEQIVEYYSARWKIEAGFREIKQEIGSSDTQTRNPDAVNNHVS
jgi:hypothetical protein